jgi:hypothetical protein
MSAFFKFIAQISQNKGTTIGCVCLFFCAIYSAFLVVYFLTDDDEIWYWRP